MFDKKKRVKGLSILITIVVLGILITNGPAQAFTLSMSVSDTAIEVGEPISFDVSLNINSDERLPVDFLTLEILGLKNINCKFNVDGSIISGCDKISIIPLGNSIKGTGDRNGTNNGNEYSWGYGIGNEQGILEYKILLDTTGMNPGDYETKFKSNIGGKVFTQIGDRITIKDTKQMDILRMSPSWNSLADGSKFSVKYNEYNLQSVKLFYGEDSLVKTDCESGENKECAFNNVDLSNYDGQSIYYWFELNDGIHNTESARLRINVDSKAPILNVVSPANGITYGRRPGFIIGVDEYAKLEYQELGSSSWKLICDNCNNYGMFVEKTEYFPRGAHTIIIKATDKIGNSDEEQISFTSSY